MYPNLAAPGSSLGILLDSMHLANAKEKKNTHVTLICSPDGQFVVSLPIETPSASKGQEDLK